MAEPVDAYETAVAKLLDVVVIRRIHNGGQKRVLLAAERNGTEVALKVVVLAQGTSSHTVDELLLRARREVALLADIDSPNVVSVRAGMAVLGATDKPDAVGWTEELLSGDDLSALLPPAKGLWEWPEVEDMILGISSGLRELHARDVVHRDLNPANVRRQADGMWTVLDPGWGRHLAEATITGVYQPGTRGYLTPEHAPGGKPGTATDMFSLGILAWQALTGTPPIPASTPDESAFRFLTREQFPSLRAHRAGLPERAYVVVDKLLQRMPARRFLDAGELLDSFEAGTL